MKPIGYWLKLVDRLIEERFGQALAAHDLQRRHWQLLNTLAAGPHAQSELDTALAPFAASTRPQVTALIERGWVTEGGELSLTDAGRQAHGTLSTQIMAQRSQILDGISQDEYTATVGVLARMAANLERSA